VESDMIDASVRLFTEFMPNIYSPAGFKGLYIPEISIEPLISYV
jgi:hypothetical protein